VYFLEIIRGLRGEKRATINRESYELLKLQFQNTTPEEWKSERLDLMNLPMKRLKLTKFKMSRAWLAFKISKGVFKPSSIRKRDLERIIIWFFHVEKAYQKVRSWVCPDRKIFMNYNYLFVCLCIMAGRVDYAVDVKLPANPKSRSVQARLWRALCCRLGWKWFDIQDYV
jgi:hypothetical protein